MTIAPRPRAAQIRTRRANALVALAGLALTSGLVATPAVAAPRPPVPATASVETLAAGGTTRELARGLTHSAFTLGDPAAVYPWTVQLTLPSGDDAVRASNVSTRAIADDVAAQLRAAGFDARVEEVIADRLADSGGSLGYRVRVGRFATQAEAVAAQQRIQALDLGAGTWYMGWDGDAVDIDPDGGPVRVQVLTINPKRFKGEVDATFGRDLETTETTSAMGADALAAINAGFFVFGAEHGAPGDPAGAGAYDGRILSETVGDRPALIIDHRRGRAAVQRLTWSGSVSARGRELTLDGINRVPGKIRNCGGLGDSPTDAPQHDVTSTAADEVVAFTPDFGASTPTGAGVEVVVDRQGRIVRLQDSRGTQLTKGQISVQATGAWAPALRKFGASARHVKLTNEYLDERGRRLAMTPHTQVVNGGPLLVVDGRLHVTAARDGMVQPDNPGAFYGWTHQRNPRTIAGIDTHGRLVLVTADGRQTDSVGLSIHETAELARDLGLVDAINLDGGGSTTMVVGGRVTNSVSGTTERAVGDAIVIRGR
ncbi:MAG: phosphodiester glycosidase family protein [Propionibacteriaceae bacterium]|nr:phosphodiester glycosidase family protein [Propionibacteriaceae bacterium]